MLRLEPLYPSCRFPPFLPASRRPTDFQPVGQFISCSIVRQAFPGVNHIAGVAADVILRVPGIRSMYALMGVRRAGRKSILEMFEDGINVSRKRA